MFPVLSANELARMYRFKQLLCFRTVRVCSRVGKVQALHGSLEGGVHAVRWRHRDAGCEETRPVRNIFLFLGADPATDCLRGGEVALDPKGFVVTGTGAMPRAAYACRWRRTCRVCLPSATFVRAL
jgi:hypothetical protein